MIHILTGLMNSGKTEIMSIYGLKNFLEGRKIYSNYHLNFPHQLINKDYVFYLGNEQPTLNNACFLLDELWVWLDCRDAIANKIATYFFLQSSKDDMMIYITSQNISQIDKRLKENYHRISFCNRLLKVNDTYKKIDNEKRFLPENLRQYLYIENKEYKRVSGFNSKLEYDFTAYVKADIFFTLYNTSQKIKSK